MHQEVYADALSEITVTGPIIRLDLVSMASTSLAANGPATPVMRQRIIMPIAGFADAVELMQKALNGLIQGGAALRPEDNTAMSVSQAELAPGNHSPNFTL